MPEGGTHPRAAPAPIPRMKRLRRYLVAGVLVWAPLVVTIFVVRILVNLMDRSLLLLPPTLRPDNLFGFHIPGLGIILTIVLLAATGMFVANFVGRQLVGQWESLLARIPLIRSVYSGVKSMAEQVLSDEARFFRQVVLVEYPRKGMWSLAFETSEVTALRHDALPPDLVCVFVPVTPNVTAGTVILLPRNEIVRIDMPVDAALKLILSHGVVPPGTWTPADAAVKLAPLRNGP